jgi:hypothetical protein
MRYKVIAGTIVLMVLLAGCLGDDKPKEVPTRESAIPKDAVKETPETDEYPPVLHSDEWEDPVPLSSVINTAGAEDSPFMMPDGNTIYFVFVGDVSVPPHVQMGKGAAGIYFSQRSGDTWTEPKRMLLGREPGASLDGCQFANEEEFWFCSVRTGNHREIDLYIGTHKAPGKVTDIHNAGKHINLEIGVGEMHISPDGEELYFHAVNPEGKGGMDLYVSKKKDGEWQEAEPIDNLNTADNDGYPCISPDGQELWFTRTYLGSPGTFRSKRNGTGWDEPELILSWFAGEPSVDAKGNIYFVHHYYHNGTMIEADLYIAYKK